ncbi:transcriptional regulator, LacI family [Chitinophaga ginsengisegetis]|uniref:Transcriptional regulator, LacI family n=1 Tax=Chitinophaga ginsengisegetis TaxID=393003 RepID=A0A1T5P9K3_9BACT|nr:LacI family DNA-binding transcriptional regulator [Chitinophaga ginsengisegetis]MDR6569113.1 LacI family transcriptional regulator/LacI family repressor for deo operon, udp, cdd, tsx, nupC, and nupG [Chitinophaga ginsengisegetis]MDR6648858.1 LacI family transcriptional regulator/LacI family repressor for deo operon, udp, cdd, tsx, nupC, and nupG [Chitinophaga ginsengisegetis]MDR6655194.1 LacI family transcriptional regulator/LacI family repressor for deo operon, udp, cdd, tsx, nupC, and nupG 
MKRHQITIVDIAKELNLSKSTVSRALTGHPSVNAVTRQAVLDLAEKLDYQRNMLAISLVTRKTNTIGIIVPEFTSSYFPNITIGAQEVASKAGYNTVICQSNETYETEVANTKVMLANQVDGVLVSITKETKNFDHLKIFQRKGIPIVFFNRVCDEMDVPKVIVDDYDGAFRAVNHLIERGRKRIAHLSGPPSLKISEKRLNGYKAALRKNNIELDEDLVIPYDLNLDKVHIYVNHLLNLPHPPDAIFAINDPTAIEIIQVVKKRGLQVPEDIAVVGFSNDFASGLIHPSLTTVSQPVKEIGGTAAQLLIDQISRDVSEWKSIIRVLKTELIVRNSS